MHFTTPQLANIFNVNVSTIKRWIDKGVIDSDRTPGGHRRVSNKQLEKFRRNFSLSTPESYVLNRINKQKKIDWEKYYRLVFENKDTESYLYIENIFISGTSILEIITDIISPALVNIGYEWTKGNMEIHDEHRMSFIIREQLLRIKGFILAPPEDAPMAILACSRDENHEIPLHIAEIIFKKNGWKSSTLGINIKINDLVKASKKLNPDLISILKIYTPKLNIKKISYSKLIKYSSEEKVRIVLAGSGWKKNDFPDSQSSVFFSTNMNHLDSYLKDKKNRK